MPSSIKEIKRAARGVLQDRYSLPVRAYINTLVISLIIEMFFSTFTTVETFSVQNIIYYLAQLIMVVISVLLITGQNIIHLKLARNQNPTILVYWYAFTHQPERYIKARLIYLAMLVLSAVPAAIGVYLVYRQENPTYLPTVILCALSLILLLLVFTTYDMTFLLILDDESLSVTEGFRKCRNMVRGHKLRMLGLFISFAGMYLLTLLTFGVGMFWVAPYIRQSYSLFYLEITDVTYPEPDESASESINNN